MDINILLIDDDRDMVFLYEEYLNEVDFKEDKVIYKKCFEGKSALVELSKMKYDLVITDVNMPGMDGLKLIEKTRKEDGFNKKTPFIVITGNSLNELDSSQEKDEVWKDVFLIDKALDLERFVFFARLAIAKKKK